MYVESQAIIKNTAGGTIQWSKSINKIIYCNSINNRNLHVHLEETD